MRCTRCHVAYHMECWFYAGRCAIFGCARDPIPVPVDPSPSGRLVGIALVGWECFVDGFLIGVAGTASVAFGRMGAESVAVLVGTVSAMMVFIGLMSMVSDGWLYLGPRMRTFRVLRPGVIGVVAAALAPRLWLALVVLLIATGLTMFRLGLTRFARRALPPAPPPEPGVTIEPEDRITFEPGAD